MARAYYAAELRAWSARATAAAAVRRCPGGAELLVPTQTIIEDGRQKTVPALYGYAFVAVDDPGQEALEFLRRDDVTTQVLTMLEGATAPLGEEDTAWVCDLLRYGADMVLKRLEPRLAAGDMVRVTRGPFAGFDGAITGKARKGRISIRLGSLDLTAPRNAVEKLG